MRPSGAGEKRPRDTQSPYDFIAGLTLSEHPFEQRKGLFMKKLSGILKCKSLNQAEFEGYTIVERFKWMGWENLFSFNCDKIYTRAVEQWMASLSRNGDELTGIVDGNSYTITPRIIRDLLGVDTRTDLPYTCFKEVNSQASTAENRIRLSEACKTVFGREENVEIMEKEGYEISMMTPLAKVLWRIAESTFLSRGSDVFCRLIYPREIYVLHSLLTGDYMYSFAHLMMDDIWDMYEQQSRRYIPYGNYISEILCRLGAVSEGECVRVIPPVHRVISKASFGMLEFLESPTEYIIYDSEMEEQVIFPKEGSRKAPPQTPVPNPNVEMTNLFNKFQYLIDKQSSILQKEYNEMKTVVTNIQKQMKRQVLEAERREQEREKLAEEREKLAEKRERKQYDEIKTMVTNIQKQMERQALEAERHEQAREKLAEERERHAQIRAHAIIWDIERQRYFYEMEQKQLRMAWNQLNGANAVDEFQFPPMSRTSLHPPQEGSPYFDPTQGDDEIPKPFQPLYHDIYGPKCKKRFSS